MAGSSRWLMTGPLGDDQHVHNRSESMVSQVPTYQMYKPGVPDSF